MEYSLKMKLVFVLDKFLLYTDKIMIKIKYNDPEENHNFPIDQKLTEEIINVDKIDGKKLFIFKKGVHKIGFEITVVSEYNNTKETRIYRTEETINNENNIKFYLAVISKCNFNSKNSKNKNHFSNNNTKTRYFNLKEESYNKVTRPGLNTGMENILIFISDKIPNVKLPNGLAPVILMMMYLFVIFLVFILPIILIILFFCLLYGVFRS